MSGEEDDQFGLSHWPEEFLLPGDFGENELWSLILVENGLKDADLRPLAEHLRRGLPLTPKFAGVIADAIDGNTDAICKISAKKLRRGRKTDVSKKARYLEIGFAVQRALQSAKRSEYDSILVAVGDKEEFGVGRTTVFKAHQYFLEWVAQIYRAVESDQRSNAATSPK